MTGTTDCQHPATSVAYRGYMPAWNVHQLECVKCGTLLHGKRDQELVEAGQRPARAPMRRSVARNGGR